MSNVGSVGLRSFICHTEQKTGPRETLLRKLRPTEQVRATRLTLPRSRRDTRTSRPLYYYDPLLTHPSQSQRESTIPPRRPWEHTGTRDTVETQSHKTWESTSLTSPVYDPPTSQSTESHSSDVPLSELLGGGQKRGKWDSLERRVLLKKVVHDFEHIPLMEKIMFHRRSHSMGKIIEVTKNQNWDKGLRR